MNKDLVTILTPTIGNSAARLEVLMREMHEFTKVRGWRHVVTDDGTNSHAMVASQQEVCNRWGALWTHCPAPGPWGISYNLNWGMRYCYTPWVYVIEDGLRPSHGWLETALDLIERIGSRGWGPKERRVGMAGFAHLQDWMLALGGVPLGDARAVFHGNSSRWLEDWNDGLWCWKRMLPQLHAALEGDTSRWESDMAIFRAVTSNSGFLSDMHPADREQAWQKWRVDCHFPAYRRAACGWYPGAFMLVNKSAWQEIGCFRDGCTFFEGHLGVRMGMAGYLSLVVEGPPWLHCPSLGFKSTHLARQPRDHRDTTEVFMQDFGHNHMDAPNVLASGVVTLDEQRQVNDELAQVELACVPQWEGWL